MSSDFRECCERGDFQEATSLLEQDTGKKIDPAEGWGDRKMTPLHRGCRHGNLPFVKLMIEKYHVDPNVTLFGGHCETPLHIAAVEGNLSIVQYLTQEVQCVADIKNGSYRRTPIIYACGFADFPPHYSDDNKAIEVVRHLYRDCGCNPDYRDGFGMTALHNACANRRFALVRFLLSECNCNASLQDHHGNTVLHMVCRDFPLPLRDNQSSEAVEIIRYLFIQHHCDPDAVNSYGQRPIDLTEDPDIIAELVSLGPYGRTAGLYKSSTSVLTRSKPC